MSDQSIEQIKIKRDAPFQEKLARYLSPEWSREHPNALNDIPLLFLSGFNDLSWCNDAMPIFQRYIGQNKHLVISIDYCKPEQRDCPDFERFSAFIIEAAQEEFEGIDVAPFLTTNDYKSFEEACNEYSSPAKEAK